MKDGKKRVTPAVDGCREGGGGTYQDAVVFRLSLPENNYGYIGVTGKQLLYQPYIFRMTVMASAALNL